jgi:lipopolysaccharide transport system permease protein
MACPVAGIVPTWRWLFVPFPMVALALMTFGIAALLAGVGALVRDTVPLVSCLLPLMMWSAPVIYVPEVLPNWARQIQAWHPLVPALDCLHQLILEASMPGISTWFLLAGWTAMFVVIGVLILYRLNAEVRDGI